MIIGGSGGRRHDAAADFVFSQPGNLLCEQHVLFEIVFVERGGIVWLLVHHGE
jgi:hypothetical protein